MKLVAYIVSSLVGFVVGHYLLSGAAAAYTSILLSYHLYLIFLVVLADHEKGLSLSLWQTLTTHLAFLALLISLPYMREHVPFFSLITLLIPGLAPFETKWLFSGQQGTIRKPEVEVPHEESTPTAEDHEAFLLYLRQQYRPFRKPGMTVDDEFKAWFTDRAKKRAAIAAMTANAASAENSGTTVRQ